MCQTQTSIEQLLTGQLASYLKGYSQQCFSCMMWIARLKAVARLKKLGRKRGGEGGEGRGGEGRGGMNLLLMK